MAEHRIKITADTESGDARVAQAHVSMISATLTVEKGDTVIWGSKNGPFRITFTDGCPVSGGPVLGSYREGDRYQTKEQKVIDTGTFCYAIQLGKIEVVAKSSC